MSINIGVKYNKQAHLYIDRSGQRLNVGFADRYLLRKFGSIPKFINEFDIIFRGRNMITLTPRTGLMSRCVQIIFVRTRYYLLINLRTN